MKVTYLVAVLGVVALNVGATTTDWGVHGPLEVATDIVTTGSFVDTYGFTLGAPGSLSSTTVANNLSTQLSLSDGEVDLFKGTPAATGDLVGSYTFDGASGNTWHTFFAADPGSYFYSVKGKGTGEAGGFYALTSTLKTAPIPEPEPLAMALVGVAATVVISRRTHQR